MLCLSEEEGRGSGAEVGSEIGDDLSGLSSEEAHFGIEKGMGNLQSGKSARISKIILFKESERGQSEEEAVAIEKEGKWGGINGRG